MYCELLWMISIYVFYVNIMKWLFWSFCIITNDNDTNTSSMTIIIMIVMNYCVND